MKRFLLSMIALSVISSCSAPVSKADLKEKIFMKEDSISQLSSKLKFGEQLDKSVDDELLALLVDFYRTFPEDEYAPECLDKIQMKYTGMGDYNMAVLYADTLISNYKDYINRAMVLENLASNYDLGIRPRDTSKVRYYNELLLKEFPNLDKEKRADVKFRLKNLNLTIEEIMKMQIELSE